MLQAAFIAFIGGVALFDSALYLPRLAALLSLLLFVFLFRRKKSLLVPVVIAGALFAFVRDRPPSAPPSSFHARHQERFFFAALRGYASTAVRLPDGSYYQLFHVTEDTSGANRPFPPDKLRIYMPNPLEEGRLYEIQAIIRPPVQRLDPGFPNSILLPEARILGAKETGPATLPDRMRDRLNRYYMRNFPPDEAGLLMSITTGDRALLGDRMRQEFTNCGLAHLISIAGLHFGMFSLTIFLLVWAVFKFLVPLKALERLTLHISPKQAAAIIALPLLAGYLMISGMRIPAIRAFIMITFFLAGLLMGRRRAWLATLLFAAFALVVWRPEALLDVSFEMSFVSVLIIGFLAENFSFLSFENRRDDGPDGGGAPHAGRMAETVSIVKRYLAGVFILSLFLAVGLMPLIAFYFHRIQWISPVANMAAVPVAGFLLIPAAVLSGFFYLATGVYPFAALSGRLARFFSSVPYSSVPAPAFPAGFLFIFYALAALAWLRRDIRYLALAVAPFIIWGGIRLFRAPDLAVTFLDCETGGAAVINLPDGRTAVADDGSSGLEAASLLQAEGKGRIDFLILPRASRNGGRGAGYLAARFRIGQVWDNGLLSLNPNVFQAPEKRLSRGDCFEGRGYKFLILHPYRGFYAAGQASQAANNASLVFKVEDSRGRSALFASGIGRQAQRDLLYLGDRLRSNIYEVPRHGGPAADWRPFIGAIRPEAAVIMPEVERNYGSPSAATIQALSSCGAKVLRTDLDGAVRVDFRKKAVSIRTFRQDALVKNPRGVRSELHNLRILLF